VNNVIKRHITSDRQMMLECKSDQCIRLRTAGKARTLALLPALIRAWIGCIKPQRKIIKLLLTRPRVSQIIRTLNEIKTDDGCCAILERCNRVVSGVAAQIDKPG